MGACETRSNARTSRIEKDRLAGSWEGGFKVSLDVTYGQHVVISEMATSAGVRCFLV